MLNFFHVVIHCAQAAITKCYRLQLKNDRNLFLTVLEARKSKTEVLSDSVSGESSLPIQPLFTVTSQSRRKGALWDFIY